MNIASLSLQHFRSYKKSTFSLSDKTTVIVGANAAGKTNILEAIMLLATGKSFRADYDREMIAWDAGMARISGIVSDGTKLEVQVTSGDLDGHPAPKKRLLVNGVPRRAIDFVGNLHAVLFWPEDLELVTDSPSIRRKYVDTALIQIDREYRRNLISYERGLRQRNRLLDLINEGKASRNQLVFWNQLLIRAGGYITEARNNFFTYLNSFTLGRIRYEVVYDKSVISESRLAQYKEEEVGARATLVGPHRDDFTIFQVQAKGTVVSREVSKYGSRGEQRLAVLWLKLGELSYIERAVGSRPILLLDDIFSELDHLHRALVLGITRKQQTIITSAEGDILKEVGEGTTESIHL